MNKINQEISEFFSAGTLLPSSLMNSLHSNVHLYTKDRDGKLLGGNAQQAISLGLRKGDDLKGFNDFDFMNVEDATHLRSNDEKVIKQNRSLIIIEKVKLLNQNQITVLSTKLPLYNTSKKTLGIIGLSIVLTQEPCNPIPNHNLTQRQIDCAYHLVLGSTIKEIARDLKISPKTVGHHLDAIKSKLHCSTRSELTKKLLKIFVIQERLKKFV